MSPSKETTNIRKETTDFTSFKNEISLSSSTKTFYASVTREFMTSPEKETFSISALTIEIIDLTKITTNIGST